MYIAVGVKDGTVSRYFEQIEEFWIYDSSDGRELDSVSSAADNEKFVEDLRDNGVEMLICGNRDHEAEVSLRRAGIKFIRDVTGTPADVVLAWKMGYLAPDDRPVCVNAHF